MIGRSIDGGRSVVVTLQSKPGSSAQVALQPSPELVLPSSHASPGNFTPSPQTAVHVPPVHFGSTSHCGEQPSFGVMLPSSQSSSPATTPSPHPAATHAAPTTGHFHPGSRTHYGLHPSFGAALPSSHVSPFSTTEFPHTTFVFEPSGVGPESP